MITPSKPSVAVFNQIVQTIDDIDGVILRFEAPDDAIIHFINRLLMYVSRDKLIVHNHPEILKACHLHRIHFKESNAFIQDFVEQHPDIQVSQSVHSLATAKRAEALGLSFALFGHVFPTPSKPNFPPRDETLIDEVTNINIPVVALGGIDEHTIKLLNSKFSGFAGIRLFTDQQQFQTVKKEWLLRTTT